MDLVFQDRDFPLWLIPGSPVSDEQLLRLREANPLLHIDREPNGEIHIEIKQMAEPQH